MSLVRTSLVLAAVCLSHVAQAAPPKPKSAAELTKEKCIADAEEGQTLRDGGKLREARERFVGCASSTCPGAVSKECSVWLADAEARMPSIVVGAIDASGADLVDVKVSVDGQPFLERLTGTQTPIDPGPHRFRFETAGAAPVEESFVIAERQKGRVLRAKFGSAKLAAPEDPSGPSGAPRTSPPVAAYVVGGVGVVALASFAFFGLKGYSDYNDLKDSCDPNCPTSATDDVKTKLLVADISLGVGVVALGVATYLFLSHGSGTKAEATVSKSSPSRLLNHAVVTPTRGGGWFAGYETRF